MTLSDTTGPNSQTLAQRRAQLKAQRKIKFYKVAWRTLAMGALAAGTIKVAASPIWLIRSPEQIEVSNNQLLSDENVQALLPVPYPQALVNVQPEVLADSLSAHQPIESAVVRRKLIPPKLHVQITERTPVAVARPNIEQPLTAIPDQPIPFEEPGLIDAQGVWIPRNSFAELGAIANPTLQVIGMRAKDAHEWRTLYREVASSPVAIMAIDWTRSDNLILESELGSVHLGPFSSRLAQQLSALDQLRRLDDRVNSEKVAFINLQDPERPIVEILQATSHSTATP
ncbi:MAG: cell division protein FtsQ/DivIB [Phormidesmis sp.]